MIRLFRVSIPASVLALLALETVFLLSCYTAAAYFVTDEDLEFYLFYDGGWRPIALVVVAIQVGLYLQDLYEHLRPRSRIYLAQQVSLVAHEVGRRTDLVSHQLRTIRPPRRLPPTGDGGG